MSIALLAPGFIDDVAPSKLTTVVVEPPSLTLIAMSPSCVWFSMTTSFVDTEILASESTPTVIPVSFNTPSVPVVVSFATADKKSVESKLSSVCAFVASPLNTALDTVEESWIPGPMVEKPEIAADGVNVESFETVATIESSTNNCTTT